MTTDDEAPGRMEWTKFKWADWLLDRKLMRCSMAAQGLWINMLALMAQSKRPGHLMEGDGPMSNEDLAFTLRQRVEDINQWVAELGNQDVFSRTEDGIIYSRRQVRDYADYAKAVSWGKKGGRPLKQQLNPPNNPPVKGEGKTPPLKEGVKGEGKTTPFDRKEKNQNQNRGEEDRKSPSSPSESHSENAREPTAWTKPAKADAAGSPRSGAKGKNGNGKADDAPPDWPKILPGMRRAKVWFEFLGPLPGKPGCLVPPELLLPNDATTAWEILRNNED